MQNYYGDPYISCRPECLQSTDCDSNMACINTKCVNPCINSCGDYAECSVINHVPMCYCIAGYTGNALFSCHPIPDNGKILSLVFYQSSIIIVLSAIYNESCYSVVYLPIPRDNPCVPSPCGHYSECRVVKDHPVCSCLPEYIGAPPNCRPECTISAECAFDKSCHNQKCVDPCPGVCGLHAMCRPVNHAAICSCMSGFTGDPFTRCVPIPEPSKFSAS